MYMYVYVCIYIYICISLSIHIHTCIYIYIYIYIHTHIRHESPDALAASGALRPAAGPSSLASNNHNNKLIT